MIEAAGGSVHWVDLPDGLRLRTAHFPGAVRGTVLLLNGRTEFIEKYFEPVAELRARGFAVWTMDWRGQGLSSRLLPDPLLHHAERFDDLLDDADRVLDRLVLPGLAGPLVLMGHSMGGHLGARLLARRPAAFDRAILCAPMIGFLRGGPVVQRLARLLAHVTCRWPAQAERLAPGARRDSRRDVAFEGNRLTGCPDRYAAHKALLHVMPDVALGGVTWGWIRAALNSVAVLGLPASMRRITMPVLVALAGDDTVVDNHAMRRFAAGLPLATLVEFPGARHELLRESDTHRLAFWSAFDRFVGPLGGTAT